MLCSDVNSYLMWNFDPKIANLRRRYKFCFRIKKHPLASVSDRTIGWTDIEDKPNEHPLDPTTPPTLGIRFIVKFNERYEQIAINDLEIVKPSAKSLMVITNGERIGDVVQGAKISYGKHRVITLDGRERIWLAPEIVMCTVQMS